MSEPNPLAFNSELWLDGSVTSSFDRRRSKGTDVVGAIT